MDRIKFALSAALVVSSIASATPVFAQNTGLFVDRPHLDFPSARRYTTIGSAEATFTVSRTFNGGISVTVSGSSVFWRVEFSAGTGIPLAVGEYQNATQFSRTSFVGLNISGDGVGCSELSGRFVVHEVVYGTNGTVLKFAADAEQHCNDVADATYVAVRYDSTVASLNPFEGDYPNYSLSIAAPVNGVVTGSTLACGGGQTACSLDALAPQVVSLSATPDSGFVFTGWTGGCAGGEHTTVYVNSVKSCGATFAPAVPTGPRNFFIAVSEPGELIGGGRTHVYSSSNSVWAVSLSGTSSVRVVLESPGIVEEAQWTVHFHAPTGQSLTPGTYSSVGSSTWALGASLSISSTDVSQCSSTTGRFVIHELELIGGAIERFSADAELHCGSSVPGLFIAIRYQSTMQEIQPFGGSYPEYRLRIEEPANGTITGAGINCTTGGGVCDWTGVAGETVALTASAAPGYVFAGWGGACTGGEHTTVTVNMLRICQATFVPMTPVAPTTLLTIQSFPGDPVGGGMSSAHSPANSSWQVSSFDGGRRLQARVVFGIAAEWLLEFAAPQGGTLGVGTYYNAFRSLFNSRANGLSISAWNRGCPVSAGRFVIHELVVSNNQVTSLAIDAEQHCNNGTPGLFAALRYNSLYADPRPFGGDYPRYELIVTPPLHGSVIGAGLSCGEGSSVCTITTATPGTVTISAVPTAHHIFMGWSGSCSGGATTTVLINMVVQCEALFEPAIPAAPRTLAVFTGEPGHEILDDDSRVFSRHNSVWTVSRFGNGNSIDISISAFAASQQINWTLRLNAPSGSALTVGTYEAPGGFSSGAPQLSFSGENEFCSSNGSFTIRELVFVPATSTVTRLAVDFVQRCGSQSPRVIGSIQFESALGVVAHRSGHDMNGDGRLDLFWQHDTEGWIAGWEMHGTRLLNARLTTPDRVADINWRIVGSADFNADGSPDLFWQNRENGLMTVWYMNGTTFLGPGLLSNNTVSDLNWQIRAIADFNADGRPDLLWHNQASGTLAVWILDGVRLVEMRLLSPSQVADTNWQVAGAADFNRDGHSDVFWRNRATGVMTVWYMNGTTFVSAGPVTPNAVADMDWEIRALADINDDGSPDVIWQRRSDGWISAWLMNGVQMIGGAGFEPAEVTDPAWRIVGPR